MSLPWSERSDLKVVQAHLEKCPEASAELGRRLGCVDRLALAHNSSLPRPLGAIDLNDLCQEIVLAMLDRLPAFQVPDGGGEADLKTWARGFVANKFYQYFSQHRRWTGALRAAELNVLEAYTLPLPKDQNEAAILWKALDALEENARRTFLLRNAEGLSFVAIAVIFGESVSTTKTRYTRTVKYLRERLQGFWDNQQ